MLGRCCCTSPRTLTVRSSRCLLSSSTQAPARAVVASRSYTRSNSTIHRNVLQDEHLSTDFKDLLFFPKMSPRERWKPGESHVTVYGFIGKPRKVSKDLVFANLELNNGEYQGQICAKDYDQAALLRKIQPYSAVLATGTMTETSSPSKFDMVISSIRYLNPFPKDIIVSHGAVFPPDARHLQLRFHAKLRESLRFRAYLKNSLSQIMTDMGYLDVETPTLFKSTSEGAREFLVPSRMKGYAYALPQSPQQYKQVLMASGLGSYFQFARCYRDEDHRADRQPEFTQLDLEKAFATGETIMTDIESVMQRTWDAMRTEYALESQEGTLIPVRKDAPCTSINRDVSQSQQTDYPEITTPFLRMKYQDCMDMYGSDKPDLRIPNRIARVDGVVSPGFVGMISGLESPVVEAWKLSLHEDVDRREAQDFVRKFLGNLDPEQLSGNPDGAPQAIVFDSSKPLQGFSSLGPDGLQALQQSAPAESGLASLQDGDIVVFQARVDQPQQGGSTKLGEIRTAMYHAAIDAELLERDDSFHFLWVTDFPMFTPEEVEEESDVGQGGAAGISATHHPFTAPLAEEDLEFLFTDPRKAKADHYDLVLNGVELGGGSRRIHVAALQEFIFRDILKMPEHKMKQFSHLLKALRAGCPPHAGFALGFDRFTAVLTGSPSVRDVIAFPKNNKGVDEFAGGPGRIGDKELETYHLQFRGKKS